MESLQERIANLSAEKRALLLEKLKQQGTAKSAPTSQPIRPINRATTGVLPLSFGQQRLWFLDQFEPGNPVYNIPMAFDLRGELNIAALERSLSEIVYRHEVLRT